MSELGYEYNNDSESIVGKERIISDMTDRYDYDPNDKDSHDDVYDHVFNHYGNLSLY